MAGKFRKNILWFKELGIGDVSLVGGKNASLGEMYNNLVAKGINIPNGFATSALAYFDFLTQTGLKKEIGTILENLDVQDLKSLQNKGGQVRKVILSGELPEDLKKEIILAYQKLSKEYGTDHTDVAVRSSATAEDLPSASFAGQQETFLNVRGEKNLLEAVKKCFASLFTDRAIVYRQEMGFSHLKVGLSVGVQKMVRSDLAASGVMFSCDTESGFPDVVLINASYGLGENVVLGRVDPDQYYVFETTLRRQDSSGQALQDSSEQAIFKPIIEKKIGSKKLKMVYQKNSSKPTKNTKTSLTEQRSFVLSDEEILTLAEWSMLVETHYKRPMDIEWAKDGIDEQLYVVQARPETVQSRRNINILKEYKIKLKSKDSKLKILAKGLSVGSKIGSGRAKKIISAKDIGRFNKGEVLVTKMTDPDWVPAMKLASAIVTDEGGRTAHAAIVSRELGIPCVVGTGNSTRIVKTGMDITVDCSGGEEGRIYEGLVPFEVKETDISKIENLRLRQGFGGQARTKILMNIGDPGQAFGLSFIPNDGVGLAREEFIIANTIRIHPNALINYKNLSPRLKKEIDNLSLGYKDKKQFYIDKLAEGIGKIGAAFYPKPVIVRFSDFKTNEYRQLVGGELYEMREENPMLGFRGASRYYSESFKEAFLLECQAIKKVREEFGVDNIQVMVPFCRTVEEGKKVLQIIEEAGLKREPSFASTSAKATVSKKDSDGGINLKPLKIYAMCEIPSNVILAEQFLELFDGFSIGSNDLTQLALGLDRDNAEIAKVGNENNKAVKEMIKEVVRVCKQKGKYSGICGQGPSDFPEFTEFLVEQEIESISLNPDSIIKIILLVSQKEKSLKQQSVNINDKK